MFQLILELIRSLKLGSASRAHISDESCVACDSADVTSLGPGAYRCNACGYEGGSGLAAMQEQNRLAQFDQMSPDERRESAQKDLLEARTVLTSCIGSLDSVRLMSGLDMVGVGGSGYAGTAGEGNEKQQALVSAQGYVFEAQNLLKDAWYKLQGHPGGALELDSPIDYTTWALDVHLDGLVGDLMMHGRIEQTRTQATQMLQAVEHALYTTFGIAPQQV